MARIIKGSSEGAPPRPLPVARAPQVAGDNKVINKEVFSARNRAEELLIQAQTASQQRAERAQQEAQEAFDAARDAASHQARSAALQAILAAYRARGDALMESWEECLGVAGGVVQRITGKPLEVPPDALKGAIMRALQARRGKFAAVIKLPADALHVLTSHAPLAARLKESPEFRLEEGEDAVVTVAGPEDIPVDLPMVAKALCLVLDVDPPELEGEAPAQEEEEAAPEDQEEAAAQDQEEPQEEAAQEEEEQPAAEEEAPPEEEAAAHQEEEDNHAAAPDEDLSEEHTGSALQAVPPDVDSHSVEVTQERPPPPPMPRPATRAVPLPVSIPATPRMDGTRVDIGTSPRVGTRPGATMSGVMRLPPLPSLDDLPARSASAVPREVTGASNAPLARPRQEHPVDGTRVDVRHSPSSTSSVVKKPLR